MISFDSRSKQLKFSTATQVDGEPATVREAYVSLETMNEDVRQLLISTAKLAIAYANGVDIASKRRIRLKQKNGTFVESEQPSLVKGLVDKIKLAAITAKPTAPKAEEDNAKASVTEAEDTQTV